MVHPLGFEPGQAANLGFKLVLGVGFEPTLTSNLENRDYKARRANHYTTLAIF